MGLSAGRRGEPALTGNDAATDCLLSALIVARNEEAHLAACLETVRFADEIVVVLDRSTDGSKGIAQSFGARIVEGAWEIEGDRRNAGIDACAGAWVLEIDADERVPPALADEILRVLPGAAPGYYGIRFNNYIGARLIAHGWGAYNGVSQKSCLFSKGAKVWGRQRVHPEIDLSGPRSMLDGRIDHLVDDSLSDTFDRINRYSTLAAIQAREDGTMPRLLPSLRRIVSRFWKSYVARRGYREGPYGLALALCSALYPIQTYLKCATATEAPAPSSASGDDA
jgi:glycosyltransferase involved in cell wall biosynthesis